MFVWLLAFGAVVAVVLLVLGIGAYIYVQLMRRGVVNPPARWTQQRPHHTQQAQDEEVIEAEYTVVEDEEDEDKNKK